jgi:hypothetical protein
MMDESLLLERSRKASISAAPASMPQASVRIYQNFYADGQDAMLDPVFITLDGRRNANTHYREVGLFLRAYHAELHRSADYTGILSPKFGDKTGKSGQEFINFILAHPGYDVYFINPFPQNSYYTFNVWVHGDYCHPGLMALAHRLFYLAGIKFNVTSMGRNHASTLLYSNYWAGNAKFWDAFMDLNVRLLTTLENLPPDLHAAYFEIDPEYPDKVPALPFIFERVFSTLLLMDPSIKAMAYPYKRYELFEAAAKNREEFEIVTGFKDMIDEIDERGEYDARDMALFDAILRMRRA